MTVILAAGLVWIGAGPAQAAVFTIDSSQSSLTATDASLDFIAIFPGVAKPGGDATTLSGTLNASVSGSSLQLLAGSSIVADDEGSFLPGITMGAANTTTPAPASFAFDYTGSSFLVDNVNDLQIALRDLALSLEDSAPRTLAGGVLGATSTDMTVLSGSGHLNAGNPAVSDLTVQSVTNVTAGAGTYNLVGTLMTIEFPIDFTTEAPDSDSYTSYSGLVVATAIVPEPSSLAIAGLAIGGLFVGRASRRRDAR